MGKILVGAEETVIVAVGRWVDRSPGDCLEGGDYKIPERSLKGIGEEPWLVIKGNNKVVVILGCD